MGYLETSVVESHENHINTLHVDFSTKFVEAVLKVFSFDDHGYVVNYIPSLNLSAYGDTQKEAFEMLTETVLPSFYDNLLECSMPVAFEHLSKLGWSAKGATNFTNSAYVDKDGVLRNFDLPEDTVIEEQLLTV